MSGRLYKIGEAAHELKLKSYVLRFWESEFPQLNPTRTESGQRLYREQDLETLRRIRHLLHERGLTIEGARKILAELTHADEGLSSDFLDEGYKDFLADQTPENSSNGIRGASEIPASNDIPGLGSQLGLQASLRANAMDMEKTRAEKARMDDLLKQVLEELKDIRRLVSVAEATSPSNISEQLS